MMLLRKKQRRDQSLDRVSGEVFLALTVSEEEIEATATSPDLYDRVRARLWEGLELRVGRQGFGWKANQADLGFAPLLMAPRRSPRWAFTAAAVLLVVALGLLLLLPKQSREDHIARPFVPQAVPSPSHDEPLIVSPGERQEPRLVASSAAGKSHAIRRNRFAERPSAEVATDFLPLTFAAESTAPEGGHLVRVTIPRSALVAMGLPMNVHRAGELVRADVFIGDDGLARAIRFIQ